MGAKDTVMGDEQIVEAEQKYIERCRQQYGIIYQFPLSGYMREDCIKEAQAEITWPIAKSQGIREVVELIDKTGLIEHTDSPLHEIGATILDCPACCWYVYKKEWGL